MKHKIHFITYVVFYTLISTFFVSASTHTKLANLANKDKEELSINTPHKNKKRSFSTYHYKNKYKHKIDKKSKNKPKAIKKLKKAKKIKKNHLNNPTKKEIRQLEVEDEFGTI